MEQERTKQIEAQARRAEAEAQARQAEAKQAETQERQRVLVLVESGKMTFEEMMVYCGKNAEGQTADPAVTDKHGRGGKNRVSREPTKTAPRLAKAVKTKDPKLKIPDPTNAACEEGWVKEYVKAYVVASPIATTLWQGIYRSFRRYCLAKGYPIPHEESTQQYFIRSLGKTTVLGRSHAWIGINLNSDGQLLGKQNPCLSIEGAIRRAR
jgi:hypothetical protein